MLEALDKTPDSYGGLLVCTLVDKLSPDIRKNLKRQLGKTDFDLQELCDALKMEVDMMGDEEQPQTNKSKGLMYFMLELKVKRVHII